MAGDAHVNESQFTGLSRYFNSTTVRGRANVALATYGAIAAIIIINKLKPSKPAAAAPAAH